MSVENVKKFYELAAKNEKLQKELISIISPLQKNETQSAEMVEKAKEKIQFLGKENGFDFTSGELFEYSKEAIQVVKKKLEDSDLANVTGGGKGATNTIIKQAAIHSVGRQHRKNGQGNRYHNNSENGSDTAEMGFTGAALGATIGTAVFPGIGTLIGGAIGAALFGTAGIFINSKNT